MSWVQFWRVLEQQAGMNRGGKQPDLQKKWDFKRTGFRGEEKGFALYIKSSIH